MSGLLELKPYVIGGTEMPSVNARDLHAYLGVGRRFGDWMPHRIAAFEFDEHTDFERYQVFAEDRGRPLTEYAITLNMAKELSMVERSPRGKEARRYFIECERRLLARQSSDGRLLSEHEWAARQARLLNLHRSYLRSYRAEGLTLREAKRAAAAAFKQRGLDLRKILPPAPREQATEHPSAPEIAREKPADVAAIAEPQPASADEAQQGLCQSICDACRGYEQNGERGVRCRKPAPRLRSIDNLWDNDEQFEELLSLADDVMARCKNRAGDIFAETVTALAAYDSKRRAARGEV